jgi:hypothetical protein
MTMIVVGGHSRKVGKTSVAAGLIDAFSQRPWTALKISSHWHTDPPTDDFLTVYEEHGREGNSDSSRYLASGAARSFWIRIREGQMGKALPQLQPILQSNPFVMIESNGILRFLQPDLYVMVLNYQVEDFKESAHETLGRANAVVAIHRDEFSPVWKDSAEKATAGVPWFTTLNPLLIPPGLLDLVEAKILGSSADRAQ